MMSEATLLESRLSKVEQDNRRLKLTLGALLLALAAVPLIGAVMPEQIPGVIEAREFHVIGENGTKRADLTFKGMTTWDEKGIPHAVITEAGIVYWDPNGTNRIIIDDRGIIYVDLEGLERNADGSWSDPGMDNYGIFSSDKNTTRAIINHTGIRYFDENFTERARMTADGIFYHDANGKLVWSTPER
jgi:hypothetical protein